MNYTSEISKTNIINDIASAKKDGEFDKVKSIYKKMPVTTCNGCGKCCYDSPIISYIEFLYIYDKFRTFPEAKQIEVLKKAIYSELYGFAIKKVPCCFLEEDKKCFVHDISPISCKAWGISSRESFEKSQHNDMETNQQYINACEKIGIKISDECTASLDYCTNVKIVKDPYKMNDDDITELVLKLMKISYKYINQAHLMRFNLSTYFSHICIGDNFEKIKIDLIKKYQDGDSGCIDKFINSIDFKKYIN